MSLTTIKHIIQPSLPQDRASQRPCLPDVQRNVLCSPRESSRYLRTHLVQGRLPLCIDPYKMGQAGTVFCFIHLKQAMLQQLLKFCILVHTLLLQPAHI